MQLTHHLHSNRVHIGWYSNRNHPLQHLHHLLHLRSQPWLILHARYSHHHKPQNLLLDENYVARISDFGLAKLLGLKQTRTSTCIRGTIGYFVPEWFRNIAITAKVDVYRFGVMLLEIICCRRNFDWGLEIQAKVTLNECAMGYYRNGSLDRLEEDDEEAKEDLMTQERFVTVSISCTQDEPWLRSTMKKVAHMLEGVISVSIPPNIC